MIFIKINIGNLSKDFKRANVITELVKNILGDVINY